MKTKKCDKCKREIYSQGFKKHIQYCDGSGILKKEKPKSLNGKAYWKGKTLSDSHKLKIKNKIQKKYNDGEDVGFIKWMRENPEKHKISSSSGGGLRKGSGRGKKGWYKGYWCDSSWELAYVIYCLEHNIKLVRNNESFNYNFNGKILKYYPDFKIDDTFIEIKGYEDFKAKEKKRQFKLKLKTLYSKEIKPILEYVIKKHGINFIKLYEKR